MCVYVCVCVCLLLFHMGLDAWNKSIDWLIDWLIKGDHDVINRSLLRKRGAYNSRWHVFGKNCFRLERVDGWCLANYAKISVKKTEKQVERSYQITWQNWLNRPRFRYPRSTRTRENTERLTKLDSISLIISALLCINTVSVSAYLTDLSPSPSVGLCVGRSVCLSVSVRKVYCAKTADWIWMPFGMMSGVGQGMGDRWREGAVWVLNLGRPIVTNGDFVA